MQRPTLNTLGRKFKRPTKTSYRKWRQPLRECRGDFRKVMTINQTPDLLVVHEAQEDEEGYSFRYEILDFTEETLTRITGGQDCDGYVEHSDRYYWSDGSWVHEGSEKYDEYAEIAGY